MPADNIARLVATLAAAVSALGAAARARRLLQHALAEVDELVFIPAQMLSEFVGVGCVRFVPTLPVPRIHVDALNTELVEV